MEYDFSSIRIVDEPLTLQILLHCSGVNRFRGRERERENVMTDTSLADSGGCRSQQFGLAKCNWYHYIPLTGCTYVGLFVPSRCSVLVPGTKNNYQEESKTKTRLSQSHPQEQLSRLQRLASGRNSPILLRSPAR